MPTLDIAHPIHAATRAYLERSQFGHVIDGEVVSSLSGRTMPIVDPSTGTVIAHAANGDPGDVDRAVGSARRAFEDGRWHRVDPLERERTLHRLADLVEEHREVFGDLDALDAGLLRTYTRGLETFAVNAIRYFAGWPTKILGDVPPVPPGLHAQHLRVPRGVIALVVPWNGPTAVIGFVAAALAGGNSVVLKPSETTPMSAVLMAQLAVEAGIPAGVFNVVQGDGAEVGRPLVEHESISLVSFTGSVATGRAIQQAAASRLTPVSLELGGKSPFIIFEDADVSVAAAAAGAGVWNGQGQICTAGSRVLVQEAIYDDVVAAIVERGRDLVVGSAFDAASQLGPLVSEAQLDRVRSYVELGKSEGAEAVLEPSTARDDGYFHGPVVFTDVTNDMRIAQEEIFGPVMSIMPFRDETEALRIANATEFGLAAGVYTRDIGRAQRMIDRLDVGTVWVNAYQLGYPTVSYGGVKQSGHGRTLGKEMIHELTTLKSAWLAYGDES